MTVGILFSVGADVGMNVAILEYLSNVYKVDVNTAGLGPTVYFAAKTAAAFIGAFVFARVSAAKCLPWAMGLGLVVILLIPLASSAFTFFVLVALMALFTANSFGMCMGLAIEKNPAKANEITSLMVMAIVGGGIISAILGVAEKAYGPIAIVFVLSACLAYLFVLGIFSATRK
jgi:fucose permease